MAYHAVRHPLRHHGNTGGRAGAACNSRPSRWGCGTISATTPRTTTRLRCAAPAFDLGITHFDLANNYGPPPGSAEEFFGGVAGDDFRAYRDELIVSTKAGYGMWPGPYGEWGSRKYLPRASTRA